MSRSPEGTVGGPFGVASMLLQFRQIKSGVEIRAGSPDASHAGWIDQKAADITGDLLFGRRLSGIGQDRAPLRLFCSIILCRECGASRGLTTVDGGSTGGFRVQTRRRPPVGQPLLG